MLQRNERDLVVTAHTRPRLVDVRAVDENAPGHDQRLRLRARLGKTALDQGEVEALLFHSLTTVKPSCRKW